jgi:hypothetical protein
MDHQAAHSARQFFIQALDSLQEAEAQRDPTEESRLLGLASGSALEGVAVIGVARREVNLKRRSAIPLKQLRTSRRD